MNGTAAQSLTHSLTFNRVSLSLTATASAAQKQQWQRRLARQLQRVSLHPALPPQAILIVRRLSDPQPGKLLGTQGTQQWATAATRQLNDCWQAATRPAQSPVSAAANSVWFADRAEWLACLSWDIVHGIASERWWWQTALPTMKTQEPQSLSPSDRLTRLWQAESQWVPPSLQYLVQQSTVKSAQLLASFSPQQAQAILTDIASTYQLPLLAPRNDQPSHTIQLLWPYLPTAAKAMLRSLLPETQLLSAICLTLPNTAALLNKAISSPSFTTPPPLKSSASQLSQPFNNPFQEDDPPISAAPQVVSIAQIVSIENTPLPPSTPEPSRTQTPTLFSPEDSHPSEAASPAPEIETSTDSTTSLSSPPLSLDAEKGIITTLGGLWYIVNILIALEWPASNLPVLPWQQLLALAQALLPDCPSDPVWALLIEAAEAVMPLPTNVLLAQWRSQTLPLVQAYLQAQLEQPFDFSQSLLEPAMLYFTRTHIDIVFSLEQIQLALRLAGLDQDPGWVPELGRVISFHYE